MDQARSENDTEKLSASRRPLYGIAGRKKIPEQVCARVGDSEVYVGIQGLDIGAVHMAARL